MYKALLVDIDGVVWRGNEILRDNIEGLKLLMRRGVKLIFMTNNSTRSRRLYADILTRILNVRIDIDHIITSGYAAAAWLREVRGCTRVYAIGEEGLIEELEQQCHIVVTRSEASKCMAEALVVGLDRNLTYEKLLTAHKLVKYCNALFVATNTDNVVPEAEYDIPGAGAIIAALKASIGREPDFIAGKPNTWILELVLKHHNLSKDDVLVIGDRIDTDIKLAVQAGVDSLLVLTGVVRNKESIKRYNYKPTYVFDSILDFVKYIYLSPTRE